MKNKIRVIDVNMLSSYMGRSLTVIVSVIVFAIVVSALISGGSAERNIIDVCIPGAADEPEATSFYEPFRIILSQQTRRPVVLAACSDGWVTGRDLYVMPIYEYLRHAETLGVVALYEVFSSDRHRDDAVVIQRAGEPDPQFESLAPDEVAFADPMSINRFWIQMAGIRELGFRMPDDVSRLRFEGSDDIDTRIVMGVLFGAYRYGACKLSDLQTLTERGVIQRGELSIAHTSRVLPELVVAARRSEAKYFEKKLGRVAKMLEEAAFQPPGDGIVALLKSAGIKRLHPIDQQQLDETRELYDTFGELF